MSKREDATVGKTLRRIMLRSTVQGTESWQASDILYPFIPHIDGLTVELAGLLPNRSHNADLFAALSNRTRQRNVHDEGPLVALFLADPFVRVADVARVLHRSGLQRIVNLPSVAQYDADYAQILDGLGIGPEREFSMLSSLAEEGLKVSVAVSHERHVDRALSLQPENVLLVPRFDHCYHEHQRSEALARLCAVIQQCKKGTTKIYTLL